jgi:hypothetical protein
VEVHRRRVGRQADHHGAPARAHQVDGEPAGGNGPDRVEGEIDTGGADRLPQRLLAGEHLRRPERPRRRAALVVRLEHRDLVGTAEHHRLEHHQPDRPGADHHRPPGRSALDACACDPCGVSAVRQRLRERTEARVGAVR